MRERRRLSQRLGDVKVRDRRGESTGQTSVAAGGWFRRRSTRSRCRFTPGQVCIQQRPFFFFFFFFSFLFSSFFLILSLLLFPLLLFFSSTRMLYVSLRFHFHSDSHTRHPLDCTQFLCCVLRFHLLSLSFSSSPFLCPSWPFLGLSSSRFFFFFFSFLFFGKIKKAAKRPAAHHLSFSD